MEMLMTLASAGRLPTLPISDINSFLQAVTQTFSTSIGSSGINYLRTPLNFYTSDEKELNALWQQLMTPTGLLAYQQTYDQLSTRSSTLPAGFGTRIFMSMPIAPITATSLIMRAIPSSVQIGSQITAGTPTLQGYRKISGVSYPVNIVQIFFNGSVLERKISELKEPTARISTQDFISVEGIELLHKFLTGDVMHAQFYSTLDDKSFSSLVGNNLLGLYHSDMGARHWIDMNFIYGRDLIDQFTEDPLPSQRTQSIDQYIKSVSISSTALVSSSSSGLETKGGINSPSFMAGLANLPSQRVAPEGKRFEPPTQLGVERRAIASPPASPVLASNPGLGLSIAPLDIANASSG